MLVRFGDRRRLVVGTLLIGLIVGLSLTAAMMVDGQIKKRGMDSLVCHARTAALSFRAEEISQFVESSAGDKNPFYLNIHRKLTQLAGPSRGHSRVFLTSLAKGKVFFLAGAGAGKPVEMGQEYLEAPAILLAAFSRGRVSAEGSIKDGWGRWMAACAPVVHPQTGQVVAVLGMYVDETHWRQQFRYPFALPLVYGGVLSLIVALCLGLKWRDGQVRNILMITHQRLNLEIGARQKAEAELRTCKSRLRKTARFVPHVLFETDANGRVIFLSGRGAGLHRVPGGLIHGEPIWDVIVPEQVVRASHCFQKVMQGQRIEEQFAIRTKDSLAVAVSVSASPMRRKGSIVGMRGVAVELVHQKRMEVAPLQCGLLPDALTRVDSLTGLPNRLLFQSQLKEAMLRRKEDDGFLVLLCLDLDRFKGVNDRYGREVGDRVLCEMGRRLKKVLRNTDTIARQGGDEFVIILEEVKNVEDIRIVVDKLQGCLGVPMEMNGDSLIMSASIGVSIRPQKAVEPLELQQSADWAMCKAKMAGRGTYQVFCWTDEAYPTVEGLMGERLRRALDRNELEIVCQPRVDVSSGALRSIETSFRWRHPVWGTVSQKKILAWAREGGFILPLWEWYFSTVCRQAAHWQQGIGFVGTIAVDLLEEQFGLPCLTEKLASLRVMAGVDASRLVLQICEQVIARGMPSVLSQMNHLHSAGYALAVVDFCRGDSCLSSLPELPVSLLKIDANILRPGWEKEDDYFCFDHMVTAAHGLGVEIVLAGIDTAVHLADVQKTGCDLVQGQLFGDGQTAAHVYATLLREQGSNSSEDLCGLCWEQLSV